MRLPTPRGGLSTRLLLLTVGFVMLAEVLIFVPSVARFRESWLLERLAAGHLAALALEATPSRAVDDALEQKLLGHVEAHAIHVEMPGMVMYMLGRNMPRRTDVEADLRVATAWRLIADAFATYVSTGNRVIRAVGPSPKDPATIVAVVLEEAPLRAAMIEFGGRIFLLSLAISFFTAGLVFLVLNWQIVRPVRALSAAMMRFRQNPEAADALIVPDPRADEIGTAQRELADMQAEVRRALHQQARLAALGTAMAKVNHDLRGILSTAALVSERLEESADPEVRRVAPRLLGALDRAADLCARTLTYAHDGIPPLRRRRFALAELVAECGQEVVEAFRDAGWSNRVDPGLTVEADREQLCRVLSNLGRNAVQAGASEVAVSARAAAGAVEIEVRDNGPGLPPRARDNLFVPFAASARPGGTGLGLAIAREILRAHGGDIALAGSTAGGTVFRLTLPQRAA
ncbi:MAG TPA: HAMP domain-containing sensor histidine kinase [Alphaproteobacteria bacterium]|nr:HAMP domain-containing sensor histidine kinase [Alphaproteobacteria bacterium]